MQEESKNKIALGLALMTVILFFSSISSCQVAGKRRKLLNQQRRARMELEERVLNLSSKNMYLQQRINQFQETLEEEKAEYQATYEALSEEITKLKGGLETVDRLRERLEEEPEETE